MRDVEYWLWPDVVNAGDVQQRRRADRLHQLRALPSARRRCVFEPEEREAIIGRMEMDYSYADLADVPGKPRADAARKAAWRALLRLAALIPCTPLS